MMTLEVSIMKPVPILESYLFCLKGYGSDIAPADGAKKPKPSTSKVASGSTSQDRIKKPAAAREEKASAATGDVEEEDEPPRKRTSSRLQGKGKGADASQSSVTATSSKSASKSTQQKMWEDAGKKIAEDNADDPELRSRMQEMENEMAKVSTKETFLRTRADAVA
jgi:hypothetical protein